MDDSVIPFLLTASRSNGGVNGAGDQLAERYAVELYELARLVCGEPPNCVFRGYCWLGGEFRALYEHTKTGFIAAFGYDTRKRKLTYVCALNY